MTMRDPEAPASTIENDARDNPAGPAGGSAARRLERARQGGRGPALDDGDGDRRRRCRGRLGVAVPQSTGAGKLDLSLSLRAQMG